MPRLLTNLRIDEVSSVDRGAGEGVRVLLTKRAASAENLYKKDGDALPTDALAYIKREFSADERQSAANSGAALPDGSFPIKTKQDLHNAIQAIGRAKDPAKAKAHIKTRARALGATDMLPDSWSKRDAEVAEKALVLAVGSILAEGGSTSEVVECFKQFHEYLLKGDQPTEDQMTVTVSKEDLDKLIADSVAKALADLSKTKKPANPKNGANVAEDHEPGDEGGDSAADDADKCDDMSDEDAKKLLAKVFGADVSKEILASIGKKAPTAKDAEIAKRDSEIADLKKRVNALTENESKAQFAKRASEIGLPETDGEQLRKAYQGDVKALDWLVGKVSELRTQVEKAGLFTEVGDSRGGVASPHDQLMAKAAEIKKAASIAGKPITEAQAYVKAMEEYPEIAKAEATERQNKVHKLAG